MGTVARILDAVLWIAGPVLWLFLKWWEAGDRLPPSGVDGIALVSFGAHPFGLTNGSSYTVERAQACLRENTGASVAWGVFKDPCEAVERTRKEEAFAGATSICVGQVTSSTDECKAILEAWKQSGREMRSIVVVTEGAHMRRDRLVWKHFLAHHFPNAGLRFTSVSAVLCADRRNPMAFQRFWRTWLLFNVFFYPFYKWFPGVRWFAKQNFRQPT